MSVYKEILSHAPKKVHNAVGLLHEEIWDKLLYQEDSAFSILNMSTSQTGFEAK
jgi:hypothetical protein